MSPARVPAGSRCRTARSRPGEGGQRGRRRRPGGHGGISAWQAWGQPTPGPSAHLASGSPQATPRRFPARDRCTGRMSDVPEARVLVVDDEDSITDLVATALRYVGFEVAVAANGRQALERAASFRPELVVLDVMLPDLDGFEVVRRLRSDGLRVPIVFLTARDATEDKVAGLTIGGDDYVTKPFSLEELVARVRAVLRRTGGGPEQSRPAPDRRSRARRGQPPGLAGRPADRADRHRVQAAALPDDERPPGAVEGPDPRPRLELRLRRRRQHRRDLHLLPAQEGRRLRAAADPHRARRRLHAAPAGARALAGITAVAIAAGPAGGRTAGPDRRRPGGQRRRDLQGAVRPPPRPSRLPAHGQPGRRSTTSWPRASGSRRRLPSGQSVIPERHVR